MHDVSPVTRSSQSRIYNLKKLYYELLVIMKCNLKNILCIYAILVSEYERTAHKYMFTCIIMHLTSFIKIN